MEHRITIDGEERVIDIRAMDEDFIVFRKMYVPPLTPDNIHTIAPHDDVDQLKRFQKEGWLQVIEEFFRRQIRAIGSCMILAWDGNGVIGKMHFTTREVHDAFRQAGGCPCVDHESMPKIIEALSDERLGELLASPSRTLQMLCFNVGHFDSRYHGKGIAKAMVEFLKQWARERGWQRLEALSCPDVVPIAVFSSDRLRRGALERRGFHIEEETRVSASEAAGRRDAIERILSGKLWPPDHWYMKTYQQNIKKVREAAQDPRWKDEYDKDYLMACDL